MLAVRPERAERHSISQNQAGEATAETPAVAPLGQSAPFLRVPPFPGARPIRFAAPAGAAKPTLTNSEIDSLVELIRAQRVGGTYWGSQPALPDAPYTLIRVRDRAQRTALLDGVRTAVVASENIDPWHLLAGASQVLVDADDDLALVAAIAGAPIECIGDGAYAALAGKPTASAL